MSGDEFSQVAPQAGSFKYYTRAYLPWIRVDKALKMSPSYLPSAGTMPLV